VADCASGFGLRISQWLTDDDLHRRWPADKRIVVGILTDVKLLSYPMPICRRWANWLSALPARTSIRTQSVNWPKRLAGQWELIRCWRASARFITTSEKCGA